MEIEFNYTNISKHGHRCNNATYQLYFTNSSVTQPTEEDLLIRIDGAKYASLDNNGSEYDNEKGTCDVKKNAREDETCKRFNKFKITNNIIQRVGGSNLTPDSKFKIWAKCVGTTEPHHTFGTGCHYDMTNKQYGIGEFKITSGTGNINNFEVYTPIKKGIISLLREIEPCGKPVALKK